MSDTDTDTIELTRGEAREVIAALATYQAQATGERDQRVRNLRDQLAAEFEFDEYREDYDDDSWLDTDDWLGFGDDNDETIRLSRAEAEDLVVALSRLEGQVDREEYELLEDIEDRIEDEFDIEARESTIDEGDRYD
jgi:hypothetical protein